MVFDFKRIITGFILILVLISSYLLQLDLFLISLIALFIFYDLFYSKLLSNFKFLLLIAIMILFALYFFNYKYLFYFFFPSFILISVFIGRFRNLFFIISLILLLFFSYDLILTNNKILYLIIFLSFFNDTIAYISGKLIKGPLIVPKISPKKTISGTLISFTASIIAILFFLDLNIFFSFLIAGSFFMGDLYFSFIKRSNLIKDFSNILSGHGGILDRIDSIFLPIYFLTIHFNVY